MLVNARLLLLSKFYSIYRYIPIKKVINTLFLGLSYFGLTLLLITCFLPTVYGQTTSPQSVTEIITDFNGFWQSSSTALNAEKPNNNHNLRSEEHTSELQSRG